MAINYTKLKCNTTLLSHLEDRFIAFDTETTGLDCYYCRIIEVGAVLFEKGKAVRRYGSLLHSTDYVPREAYMVNRISSAMVRNAPEPDQVYRELVAFLGDALQGDTVIVGHNATFDMKFLATDLRRYGYSADILYADTCALSRKVMPMLPDHRQETVAARYGVNNRQSHRAVTDAETCGEIMVRLVRDLREDESICDESEKRDAKREKSVPGDEGQAFCRRLACLARDRGLFDEYLCFHQAGKLLHVDSGVPLLSVNLLCRHPYLVTEERVLLELREAGCLPEGAETEDCSGAEDKFFEHGVRVHAGEQLEELAEQILVRTLDACEGSKKKILSDAQARWELRRDMELYWKPEM